MSDEPVAPEARGVTVELLATVELGPEIEGMEGRQLRMRMVTIEPGGVFGWFATLLPSVGWIRLRKMSRRAVFTAS